MHMENENGKENIIYSILSCRLLFFSSSTMSQRKTTFLATSSKHFHSNPLPEFFFFLFFQQIYLLCIKKPLIVFILILFHHCCVSLNFKKTRISSFSFFLFMQHMDVFHSFYNKKSDYILHINVFVL